jgi:DNA-directed RNA polymerase specialized sigma24 family protein
VIDNLLERAVEQLDTPPYERVPGPTTAWRLAGSDAEIPRTHDRGPLVVRLRRLPRRPGEGTERASSVWTGEVLELALTDLLHSLDVVDRNLLDEIFRDALTALVLGELDPSTDGSDSAELSPGPEDEAMVADAVERALARLDDGERTILKLKFDDKTDDAVAAVLGVSRQTVDKRKRAAFEKLRSGLGTLPDHLDDQIADVIRARLVGGPA